MSRSSPSFLVRTRSMMIAARGSTMKPDVSPERHQYRGEDLLAIPYSPSSRSHASLSLLDHQVSSATWAGDTRSIDSQSLPPLGSLSNGQERFLQPFHCLEVPRS